MFKLVQTRDRDTKQTFLNRYREAYKFLKLQDEVDRNNVRSYEFNYKCIHIRVSN